MPATSGGAVAVVAVPGGGIQPQALTDQNGVVHLLYFTGEPSGGDLHYVRVDRRGRPLSAPVRVNSTPGTALATGSVRGGQLALGRNGRVHVAWHDATPPTEGARTVPLWYARSTPDRTRFEPQRAVPGPADGRDGVTVAAGQTGQVVVGWHAAGAQPGEDHRTVYLARSTDDGVTFSSGAPPTDARVGACGCCGLRALFDRAGTLHVLYRAATGRTHRDTTWLRIDGVVSRTPVRVHPWDLEACPMSTFALADTPVGLVAAWETAQQIYSATLDPVSGAVAGLAGVPGTGSRKHPAIAVNRNGDRLLAWTEDTAWKRGGHLAWRLTDRSGTERAAAANAGAVPVWGLVSAAALPDGSFLIFR